MAASGTHGLRFALALLCLLWLSGCVPVRETVVVMPAIEGGVVDESGVPVSRAQVGVVGGMASGAPLPDLVMTEPGGRFTFGRVEQIRTRVKPPMVGGTYRTAIRLRARHGDYADGFAVVGYVFPGQTQAGGVPIILFREWAPLPEELKTCELYPEEHYAYTLATRLEALVAAPWFVDYVRADDNRLGVLHETVSLTLERAARRCGHPHALTQPYERVLEPLWRP
ncbi:hypothetical protein B1C78_08915 [Thioalkalivibrio denitrificans]|uniref:Uncharacterized protein n=1 Tax=Thioalkalivibrio denitrificans TaxID=108003 RepID=A0A1V3NHH6_9GAMM|nr:hypothetical protein [Thioalkalivibrio denitrificans]OOG24328.1 hypothetical protein B1C78_08915 [Thioalkalivibrio denitrificans]